MKISDDQIDNLNRNEGIDALARMPKKVANDQSTSAHEVIKNLDDGTRECWESAFEIYPGPA